MTRALTARRSHAGYVRWMPQMLTGPLLSTGNNLTRIYNTCKKSKVTGQTWPPKYLYGGELTGKILGDDCYITPILLLDPRHLSGVASTDGMLRGLRLFCQFVHSMYYDMNEARGSC